MLKVGDKVTCIKPNHMSILRDSSGNVDESKVFEITRSCFDYGTRFVDIKDSKGKTCAGFFEFRFERVPEELEVPRLKVGDRVTCVIPDVNNKPTTDREKVFVVDRVCTDRGRRDTLLYFKDERGVCVGGGFFENRFTLVPGFVPRFKKGDKLEVISCTSHRFKKGQVVTVDKYEGEFVRCYDGGLSQILKEEQVKPYVALVLSKFCVGDKLMIVKNTTGGFKVGTEVTVDTVIREDDGSVRTYKVSGVMPSGNTTTMYHPENNLDYVPVAPLVSKFKEGDAVKVIKNSLGGHPVGTLAVVEKVRKRDSGSLYYDLKADCLEFPLCHLECDLELQEVVYEIGDTVEIVNESEWTFEVTNKAQIDYGTVAAELTRKNPVAIVDDPENEEVIFLVSAFFQGKLEELGTPFFSDCEVTHRDHFSLFFVPRKSAEAFTKLLVEAGKAKYPREARRQVKVVLPKMK